MPSGFKKATKEAAKLRLALAGPAGAGKTYTGLQIGKYLAGDLPLAVIDTERGSASKYSDLFEFDTLELDSFHPQRYIDAIHDAEDNGYGALLIDSLSHAWIGKGGVLDLHDQATQREQGKNSYTSWRSVTPLHNALVEALVACKVHVIVTLRSKTAYVQEKDNEGRTKIRRVGMEAIQRDGLEYEFDVYGDMDYSNGLTISKTRCPDLQGEFIVKPGREFAETLLNWVSTGVPHEVRVAEAVAAHAAAVADAKKVGKDPKPLPENATVQQIERWTALIRKAIDESSDSESSGK